jgi:Ca2+-binding RTX toxin-like protein
MASIYAGLNTLKARTADGHNNDGDGDNSNDIGFHGDPYIRITEAQYVSNASDGTSGGPFSPVPGPNGMVLPVAPTDPFPGFAGNPFFDSILDFEGAGAGLLPDRLKGDMPQARAVSNAVMALGPNDQNHPSSFAVNELFDFFGQFLTHDSAEASVDAGTDVPLLIDGLPFPFGRTPGVVDADGVRQQHNDETAFLDLSMVYGNNQARLDLARADTSTGSGIQSAKLLLGANDLLPTIKEVAIDSGIDNNLLESGSLEVLRIFTDPGFGGLPDPDDPTLVDSTYENSFYAGDNRVNQQGPLITLQTIWAREHNYLVDQLTPIAGAEGWSQDELFEAARAINEAQFQSIVYNEYLPKLIGSQSDALLDAYKATHPDIPTGIINEWATTAFRFGHDQSSNDYTLLNADGTPYLTLDLGTNTLTPTTTLGNAFALAGAAADATQVFTGSGHSAADIDAWARGLSAQFTQELDGFVADGNRNVLFGIGATVDLNAFDIQRGRDHGVWNFNALRTGLGLAAYTSFTDFATKNGYDPLDDRMVALANVYGNDINKLDSIVGGLLEKRYADSQLGETFTLLNAIQFDVLKNDTFFYEQRLADNPELLAGIMGTTFADIIMRNSGADHLHLDTFQVANRMQYGNGSDFKNGADIAANLKADLMIGGGGNDWLNGREGSDTLYGDAGNDTLHGGNGNDYLRGGEGRDGLYGGLGDDNAQGEGGNDYITLNAGDDWASGGAGADEISGGDGDDTLLGDAGNDYLSGGTDDDQLFGGDGNDLLDGNGGDDKAFGGAGNDNLLGGGGEDELHGEEGNDRISGGAGDDVVDGGAGNDYLEGNGGDDVFVFAPDFGNDRVVGFDANPAGGQDLIDLKAFDIDDAVEFAARVDIDDIGADTLVTIDGNASQTIRLVGVGNANTVTIDDFLYIA